MADLTPDRLAELRRIAVEITLGTYEWRIIETGLALLDCIEALEQELDAARAEAERWKRQYEALRDALIVVHPAQSGHVRIVVSGDGPAEALMTPDEARDLARRLLWAVGVADAVRKRGLDDEVGVGLTYPGGDET